MTKDKLKQEVEEYISCRPTEGTKDFVVYKVQVGENAFSYVVEHKNELSFSDWIKMYEGTEQECYRVVGYLDSAESREKRIEELENKIAELNMKIDGLEEQNSYMFDTIALQEQQIEKMRCCENCQTVRDAEGNCYLEKDGKCINLSKWELKENG